MIKDEWTCFPQDQMHVLCVISGACMHTSADVNEIVKLIDSFDQEGCTIGYKRDSSGFKMSITDGKGDHIYNYIITNFNDPDMDTIIESIKNMKNQSG
jgi:hypothetical protein